MEILELNEDLVIGAGGHKKVYIDPRDNKRCIKILLEEKCEDWEREKKYREIRKARGQQAVKISLRYVHAYRIVLFKMLKAYLKKRRLKLVHARIYAFKIVDIFLAASIVSKLS